MRLVVFYISSHCRVIPRKDQNQHSFNHTNKPCQTESYISYSSAPLLSKKWLKMHQWATLGDTLEFILSQFHVLDAVKTHKSADTLYNRQKGLLSQVVKFQVLFSVNAASELSFPDIFKHFLYFVPLCSLLPDNGPLFCLLSGCFNHVLF